MKSNVKFDFNDNKFIIEKPYNKQYSNYEISEIK